MNLYRPVAIVLFLAMATPAAKAQLLSERVDGLTRVCIYAGTSAVVSNSSTRELRVGIGQNCPLTPASGISDLDPPPSARLASQAIDGGRRICSYEQMNRSWSFSLPVNQSCPLYAGMVPRDPRR